jgi:serine/threonine protein kinase
MNKLEKYRKYKNKYLLMKQKLKNQYGGYFKCPENENASCNPLTNIFIDNILEKFKIPGNNIKCSKEVKYISKGSHGFTIKIICGDKPYIVKFLTPMFDLWECNRSRFDALQNYKRTYYQNVIKEYTNLSQLDNTNIIKSYGYFTFGGIFDNSINPKIGDKIGTTNIVMNNGEMSVFEIKGKESYKLSRLETKNCPDYPLLFGGIIMEYVDNSLEDLKKDPTITKKNHFKLFLDYLSGIQYLYETGFIHGDIKPANLRYNYKELQNGEMYIEGKIIDIDLRNINADNFTPASFTYMPEDLSKKITKNIEEAKNSTNSVIKKIIIAENKLLYSKYDLYMLAKSYIIQDKKTKEYEVGVFADDAEITRLLNKCINYEFTITEAFIEFSKLYMSLYRPVYN